MTVKTVSDAYDPRILGEELYRIIFKPVEGELKKTGTQTLMWSLDDSLHYIPMAALWDGEKYLVERYQNVVFTRANRERMTRNVSRNWTGTGFGSSREQVVDLPGEDTIRFPALPGVDQELQSIFRTKSYPGGIIDGEVFSEARFTKLSLLTTLKQRRPVVHISSHFRFRPGDEHESFLLLGDGQVMTLAEMKGTANLFQGVELLTLSACDTAAQRPDATGREIDGFAELAQRLGAGGVMASLWAVLDSSTAQLMKGFYVNREGRRLNKAASLRNAQLDLLYGRSSVPPLRRIGEGAQVSAKQGDKTSRRASPADADIEVEAKYRVRFRLDGQKPFAHPYYWSPFVLFGNWK